MRDKDGKRRRYGHQKESEPAMYLYEDGTCQESKSKSLFCAKCCHQ